MKKLLFSFICIFTLFTYSFGQSDLSIEEPEFIGEAFILKPDNSTIDLDKETVRLRTRAGLSVYLVGIGKVKTKIQVSGCCASSRYTPKDEIKIIVRAVDNNTDPMAIIQIFKFKKKKKKRLAELASVGTFSGGSSNNLDYLRFKAKKYGENSYILTIKKFERNAEYGLIVKNPNARDEKTTIVSAFGID